MISEMILATTMITGTTTNISLEKSVTDLAARKSPIRIVEQMDDSFIELAARRSGVRIDVRKDINVDNIARKNTMRVVATK
jgi:hypothetical protein